MLNFLKNRMNYHPKPLQGDDSSGEENWGEGYSGDPILLQLHDILGVINLQVGKFKVTILLVKTLG